MLKVSGVAISVTKAGKASLNSFHSTCAMDSVINAPTRISAGAVANAGIAAATGEKNMAARNNAATIMLLSPVRAGGTFDIAGDRGCAGQRAENGSDSIGEQRASDTRDLSVLDEPALFADANHRADVVEEVDKQKNKDNFDQAQMQRAFDVELQEGGGGIGPRQEGAGPVRQAAENPEKSRAQNSQ